MNPLLSVMKYSLWSVKSLFRTSVFKSQLKYASTQVQKLQYENESSQKYCQFAGRSKKKVFFSPVLPREKLEKLDNITSVVVGLNLISWTKISVNNLTVVDWNAHSLPNDFLEHVTETDIIEAAHTVKTKIPNSELYVMETVPHKLNHCPNYICFRSMLVLLLSSLSNGAKSHNIVFQKLSVLNMVHSLLIGGERTSAKTILKKRISLFSSENDTNELKEKAKIDCYSLLNIQNSQLRCFSTYSIEKQEGLSVALLLALTFLDIAVFQNQESLSLINTKQYHKALHCLPLQ